MNEWESRRGEWLDRHPIVGSLIFAVPFGLPLLLLAVATSQAWLYAVAVLLVLVLFVTTLAVWKSKLRERSP